MRLSICIGILISLLKNRTISAKALAQEFEVSTRTIYRYVDALAQAGVPVYSKSGRYGGISITDNFCIDKMYFSQPELDRLALFIKKGAVDFHDKISQALLNKLECLKNFKQSFGYALSGDCLYIDNLDWREQSNAINISAASEAVAKCIVCNIDYIDQGGNISNRDIEPHTLVLKENVWYVYAYCHNREQFRLFRLSRIKTIIFSTKQFVRREINVPAALTIKNVDSINMVLEFEKPLLSDIEEWLGYKNIFVSEGKYQIRAAVFDSDPLIKKLLSFGSKIKVLEPPLLKQRLAEQALQIFKSNTD